MTEKHGATLIFDTINPLFIKLAKRLNQLSCQCPMGLALINVTIIMVDGEPMVWTRPEVSNLTTSEPKGRDDELIQKLKNLRK